MTPTPVSFALPLYQRSDLGAVQPLCRDTLPPVVIRLDDGLDDLDESVERISTCVASGDTG